MTRERRPSPQTVAVLRAFSVAPATWRYGYDLGQEVGLKAGSLYPILMRLTDRGLLDACWESDPPPGRPPRHLYRLSRDGLAFAAALAAAQTAAPAPAPRPTRSARPARPARSARRPEPGLGSA